MENKSILMLNLAVVCSLRVFSRNDENTLQFQVSRKVQSRTEWNKTDRNDFCEKNTSDTRAFNYKLKVIGAVQPYNQAKSAVEKWK